MKKEKIAKVLWWVCSISIILMLIVGWSLFGKAIIQSLNENSFSSTTQTVSPDQEEFAVVGETVSYENLLEIFQSSSENENGGVSSQIIPNGNYEGVMLSGDVIYIEGNFLYLISGYTLVIEQNKPAYFEASDTLAICVPETTKILFYNGQKPINVPNPEIKNFKDIKIGDFVVISVQFSPDQAMEIIWFGLNPSKVF
jgi:hypothetical protein